MGRENIPQAMMSAVVAIIMCIAFYPLYEQIGLNTGILTLVIVLIAIAIIAKIILTIMDMW